MTEETLSIKIPIRRNEELANSGINFIGTGVSGGEKGAPRRPFYHAWWAKEAYELVADVLEEISAKAPEDGKPCVTYIGPDGAGHYVKMVHNGIEYGDMQLIAESYDLMQHLFGLSAEDMAEIFTEWNKGELDSYLIEITADILSRKDDEGQDGPIVDYILDAAGNKGTGNGLANQRLTSVCHCHSLLSPCLPAIFLLTKKNVYMPAKSCQNHLPSNLKEIKLS